MISLMRDDDVDNETITVFLIMNNIDDKNSD